MDSDQGSTVNKDSVVVTDCEKATQEDLMQYACHLTLDPNTVNNHLTLSDGNKRVTYGDLQKYPACPQRFESQPQVLCKEGLTGYHYWEVEWSSGDGADVGVAVAYNTIERKGNCNAAKFGENDVSWLFKKHGHSLQAYHKVAVWKGPVPPSGCRRLGVFLNWPAGTLSFYDATHKALSHIYTFRTKFTKPVYPGFWLNHKSSYIHLHPH